MRKALIREIAPETVLEWIEAEEYVISQYQSMRFGNTFRASDCANIRASTAICLRRVLSQLRLERERARAPCDCFKSRRRLEAEILVLRHQLSVLQQRMPGRVHLRWADRAVFIWLYRCCPCMLDAITIVRPETVVRWQRMGFAVYWRWKSRPPGGRPRIDKEIRDLIQRMSLENRLWGATKIHGELLKLGIEIAQSTVSITWCRGEIGHCKLGRPSFAISNIIATHVSDFSEATPAKACSTGRSGGSRSSNYC
jgi:hypothetical protein